MKYATATPYIASYVIFRKGNKVAFVLRENTDWMSGHYGLPSGKVEKNENYSTAAIREGFEEVGVKVRPAHLKFVHVMHRREGMDWVDLYYEATKWQGELHNAEPHIHSELAWHELDNLPENVIPSVRFALDQIKAGNMYSEYGWE